MKFTRERLFRVHDMLTVEAKSLMKEKNEAYAEEGDIFRNFMMPENVGICSAETGILIRMQDKFSRLLSFTQRGAEALGSEGYRDSIIDLINYMVLLHSLIIHKRELAEGVEVEEVE